MTMSRDDKKTEMVKLSQSPASFHPYIPSSAAKLSAHDASLMQMLNQFRRTVPIDKNTSKVKKEDWFYHIANHFLDSKSRADLKSCAQYLYQSVPYTKEDVTKWNMKNQIRFFKEGNDEKKAKSALSYFFDGRFNEINLYSLTTYEIRNIKLALLSNNYNFMQSNVVKSKCCDAVAECGCNALKCGGESATLAGLVVSLVYMGAGLVACWCPSAACLQGSCWTTSCMSTSYYSTAGATGFGCGSVGSCTYGMLSYGKIKAELKAAKECVNEYFTLLEFEKVLTQKSKKEDELPLVAALRP